MKKIIFTTVFLTFTLNACSNVALPKDQHEQLESAEKARKCQELREEIDDLKGKPIQRGAHMEYYEDLCLSPDSL